MHLLPVASRKQALVFLVQTWDEEEGDVQFNPILQYEPVPIPSFNWSIMDTQSQADSYQYTLP